MSVAAAKVVVAFSFLWLFKFQLIGCTVFKFAENGKNGPAGGVSIPGYSVIHSALNEALMAQSSSLGVVAGSLRQLFRMPLGLRSTSSRPSSDWSVQEGAVAVGNLDLVSNAEVVLLVVHDPSVAVVRATEQARCDVSSLVVTHSHLWAACSTGRLAVLVQYYAPME